jgi:hypothetical protein
MTTRKRAMSRPVDGLVVCVRHRDGWCATLRNHLRYADSVPTICGYKVTMPWGLERREPDCDECRRILADNDKADFCERSEAK